MHWKIEKVHVTGFIAIFALLQSSGTELAMSPRCTRIPSFRICRPTLLLAPQKPADLFIRWFAFLKSCRLTDTRLSPALYAAAYSTTVLLCNSAIHAEKMSALLVSMPSRMFGGGGTGINATRCLGLRTFTKFKGERHMQKRLQHKTVNCHECGDQNRAQGGPKVWVTNLGLGDSVLVVLLWSQVEGCSKKVSMKRYVENVIQCADILCPLQEKPRSKCLSCLRTRIILLFLRSGSFWRRLGQDQVSLLIQLAGQLRATEQFPCSTCQ